MPSPPIVFDHVWKRYRIGSQHDSLRDAIPAFLKRMAGRNGHELSEGDFWALKGISFSVQRGEMLGMIGPNGAGKSTILKLLSKISKQTKGEIRVQGRLAALIEVGAGFHPDLTGRENIYLNGTILGLRHRQINRLFDAIVDFSELEKFLDMPVKRYSSGMSVRLGFAIAAHIRPENLLIDEVLAVGDLSFQQKCYQRILDLKANGTTMVFVSHNLEAVQRLCDRVILLDRGEVLRDGPPADVGLYYRQDVMRRSGFQATKSLSTASVMTSGAVEVTHAQVLEARGEPQETFRTGDPMRVALRFLAHRAIQQPSVMVTIERLDGLVCHETSTHLSDLSWQAWHGQVSLVLRYLALTLLPNTYQVIVAVHEGRNPAPLVRLRNQLYFHITADCHRRGAVHLEHVWDVGQAGG